MSLATVHHGIDSTNASGFDPRSFAFPWQTDGHPGAGVRHGIRF
ncbi:MULTISPECIES: hypothetical protein [unclassified Cryobacterium]|nr:MULTISPECIES: hypothetical protein [unclassified Cryobacterium]